MKSTRDIVLQTLLQNSRCTVNELAESVGINPISVRHHISKLEAENLVASDEERHGVGRPRRVYFLTEKGLERFPSRYVQMSLRLLNQLKQIMPDVKVKELFSEIAENIVTDYTDLDQLDRLSLEQRLDLMKELLAKEGHLVEWSCQGEVYEIQDMGCPFIRISEDHPEVCALDQTIIAKILAVPVEQKHCVLNGDTQCVYLVRKTTG